tara:strand:+ start:1619 stop:1912 length:294 start_codon:yes stop_codon:yes gene_type:complete
MSIFVLIGIDPYLQPGVHAIYKFSEKKELYEFVEKWLESEYDTHIDPNKTKSDNLKVSHINKYIEQLKKEDYINYYRHFQDQKYPGPFEWKWMIFEL